MKVTRYVLGVLCAFSLFSAAAAHADSRIRTLKHVPDRVVELEAVFGYQVSVEFPSSETIESVAVGDSVAWQVTPNKSGTALFVKPVEEGGATNMTVITSSERYVFALRAIHPDDIDPGKILFVLKFQDPPKPKTKSKGSTTTGPAVPGSSDVGAANRRNKSYSYSGSRMLVPSRVFDDGRTTYFQWNRSIETPAIFILSTDGKESIVNTAFVDGFILVDRVVPRFRLRRGEEVTDLFNDSYVLPDPGPDAPRERAPKKRRLFGAK